MGYSRKWNKFRKLAKNEAKYGNRFYSHGFWNCVKNYQLDQKRSNKDTLLRFTS